MCVCMYDVCMYDVCMYDVCMYDVCMYDVCMYVCMHVCMHMHVCILFMEAMACETEIEITKYPLT